MILVTGATGNVGTELVRWLTARGQPIRVFTRDLRKVAHLDSKIDRVEGDFDKPETLSIAMEGVDRLFLLTDETRHAIHVLEAAKRCGVRTVVNLSTGEVLWPDQLPIGRWNLEREKLIEESGLTWTMLRPGQFMSNALWWAIPVKKIGTVLFPGGKGRTALIDPHDIAEVAALALTEPGHEGKYYVLTGAELLTTRQMVDILSKVLGKQLRYIDPPQFVLRFFMRRAGMRPDLVEGLLALAALAKRGEMEVQVDTFQQLTGHQPRTFEEWCHNHIEAFQ